MIFRGFTQRVILLIILGKSPFFVSNKCVLEHAAKDNSVILVIPDSIPGIPVVSISKNTNVFISLITK